MSVSKARGASISGVAGGYGPLDSALRMSVSNMPLDVVIDPVAQILGTPDTAYEFTSSSLSGLTALGSPDTEDANTTLPGHLFLRDSGATYAWVGRYLTPPSAPWTAVTKVRLLPIANYNAAGLFLGVSSPGNMDIINYGYEDGRKVTLARVTPSAFGSSITSGASTISLEQCYFGIIVNSSSDVDYLYSFDGYIWRTLSVARNPSITIGSVGIAAKSENGSTDVSAGFDYLRIWNSSKTFPGGS